MNSVKGAALCLIAIGALGVGYAQITIPRDKIPSKIPAEVRKQIEGLYSDDRDKAIEAAVNLGEMGEKAAPAVPFLMDLVGVPSSGISSYPRELALRFVPDDVFVLDSGDTIGVEGATSLSAAVALAKIGKPALQPLLAALQSTNPDVVYGAVRALALMKDAVATDALVKAIKDENLKGRADAVREIGRTRDPRVVDALIDLLKDKDPELRLAAILGLGKAKDSRAVDPLTVALQDENAMVRLEAADALGSIKDSRAVGPLIVALHDKNADVRRVAADALGSVKDSRAVGPLIAALHDEDADVRRVAARALRDITGQEFGDNPWGWEEWWKKKQAN